VHATLQRTHVFHFVNFRHFVLRSRSLGEVLELLLAISVFVDSTAPCLDAH